MGAAAATAAAASSTGDSSSCCRSRTWQAVGTEVPHYCEPCHSEHNSLVNNFGAPFVRPPAFPLLATANMPLTMNKPGSPNVFTAVRDHCAAVKQAGLVALRTPSERAGSPKAAYPPIII